MSGRDDRENEVAFPYQRFEVGQVLDARGCSLLPRLAAATLQAGDDSEAARREDVSSGAAHLAGAEDGDGSKLHLQPIVT